MNQLFRTRFMASALLFSMLNFGSVSARSEVIFEEGLRSFEKTYYPLLMARCAQCHGDSGPQIPHSSSDVVTAYTSARSLINFADLQNSRMLKMIRKRHWLSEDPSVSGMTEDEARTAIQDWWNAGESAVATKFDFVSKAQVIPANIHTMAEGLFSSMQWDLGDSDSRLAGCVFGLEIQRAFAGSGQVPGSYRIRSPRLICAKQSIAVESLFLSINDSVATYENLYDSISAQVPANSSVVPLSKEIMISVSRGAIDQMKVVFRKLTIQ